MNVNICVTGSWLICSVGAAPADLSPQEIVKRSVVANERDWQAAPTFTFQDREVQFKGKIKTDRTYQVRIIEGSEYRRLIATDGHPLSAALQKQEEEREQREIARRRAESPSQRAARVRQYQQERTQNHVLMNEMVRAFNFRLVGEETVSGHAAYVLEATPKPDYKPVNRDAKVLTGMKGKLWVDKEQFHWAKVEAEVVRPVSFHFIAKVGPGTKFSLEETPVSGQIWQPKQFTVQVAATVMMWQRNSRSAETFSNYRAEAAQGATDARTK